MAHSRARPSLHFPSFLSHPAMYLRSKLGALAFDAASTAARRAVLGLLSSIELGTLVLVDEPHGKTLVFGQGDDIPAAAGMNGNGNSLVSGRDAPSAATNSNGDRNGGHHHPDPKNHASPAPSRVTLTVTSPTFYLRLLLLADMGFAAAYLLGEVRCADLTGFFALFIRNRAALNNGSTGWSAGVLALLARSSGVVGFGGGGFGGGGFGGGGGGGGGNTVSNAQLNAAAHYDLGNGMFAAFLSPDMTYSCPIWGSAADFGGENKEETLEAAQMRKLHRIIGQARIKATDHVLEIGTGWGSFAIEAVKATGCRVTTLTLSCEQKALAEERIRAEGMDGRIQVLLMDYRALPVPPVSYDKVVSIEMLEAVGKDFLGTYFGCVDKLLKREGGIAVFQCITMPEGRHQAYSQRTDFINEYIFPGGYLPSVTQVLNHIAIESKGTLIVERVENIGGHYARTLRLWKEQFLAKFDQKIRPALLEEHPGMGDDEVDVFRRKWEYYFTYSEAGFLTKTLGDVIITVGREGAMELMEGIPI